MADEKHTVRLHRVIKCPAVIPVEMCYLGWQESLAMLIRLVEAEVP